MQHRRKKLPWVLAVLALLAAGFVFLMFKNIPAPQQKIEKPLETAKFIKPKL